LPFRGKRACKPMRSGRSDGTEVLSRPVNPEFITVSGFTGPVHRMLATELWPHDERASARLHEQDPAGPNQPRPMGRQVSCRECAAAG
jgi:hypothetical protein